MAKEKLETGVQEETVTLKKSELQGIVAQLVNDELKNRGNVRKIKRVNEHTARIRFHDEKPVVWYGNVKEKKDVNGKMVAFMDVRLLGVKDPVTVEYLAFLNDNNHYQVSIKKQTAEEVEESHGTFIPENPNPAVDPATGRPLGDKNWRAKETESVVRSYRYTAEVEVLDGPHKGETFTVPSNCLNQ